MQHETGGGQEIISVWEAPSAGLLRKEEDGWGEGRGGMELVVAAERGFEGLCWWVCPLSHAGLSLQCCRVYRDWRATLGLP